MTKPSSPSARMFLCPLCQSPLMPHAKTWTCDGSSDYKNNDKHTQHPFDVARQGYVNLLPVHHKKSKTPGDSAESINARHRFLQAGHYEPLLNAIKDLMTSLIGDKANTPLVNPSWLDVGCGEGYYTLGMAQVLNRLSMVGVDVSKPAVMQLAKSAKQRGKLWSQQSPLHESGIYPLVASASNLPLADGSVVGISSIFSPILPSEFARVMAEGGRLIIAKPDVGHLQSVREALFDEVREHDSDKFLLELEPYFTLTRRIDVSSKLRLNNQAMIDLLTMTPYAYRAKRERRESLLEQVEQEGAFITQANFVVYELIKAGQPI